MLRRRLSTRLVALLVYALAVHGLVASIGVSHASLSAASWCGLTTAKSPGQDRQSSQLDDLCRIACAVAAAPPDTSAARIPADWTTTATRAPSLGPALPALPRSPAQARAPPRQLSA